MEVVVTEEIRVKARRAMSRINMMGQRVVGVRCPDCGSGGGQNLYSYQPKCHVCDYEVLMQPSGNGEIACTWEEAVAFYTELDTKLGNPIKS